MSDQQQFESDDDVRLQFPDDIVEGPEALRREIMALNFNLEQRIPEMHERIDALTEKARNAVTRDESKRRARTSIFLVLLAAFLGIFGSVIFTLGVAVPECFFANSVVSNHFAAPGWCSTIPNYNKTVKDNRKAADQLTKAKSQLKDLAIKETAKIAELENRIRVLEQKH